MPGYKTHLIGGAFSYVALVALLSAVRTIPINPTLPTLFEWLLFSLAGSLFPDIDIKSKGQKLFYKILLIILLVLAYQKQFFLMAILSIVSCLPLVVKHRGLFHKWWLVLGLPFVLALVGGCYVPGCQKIYCLNALFFAIGGLSHLILDRGFVKAFRA